MREGCPGPHGAPGQVIRMRRSLLNADGVAGWRFMHVLQMYTLYIIALLTGVADRKHEVYWFRLHHIYKASDGDLDTEYLAANFQGA